MRDVTIRWAGQLLSPAAIEQSADARHLVGVLDRFDDALVRHGVPEPMRTPPGFRVEVFEHADVGSGGADRIGLSVNAGKFRDATARNPDVITHELAHGSIRRANLPLRATKEGWPDAVARAIAIEHGDDAVRPWSMVRDGFRELPEAPWGDMRDPLTARLASVADLERRGKVIGAYRKSRFGDEEFAALEAYHGRPLPSFARGYNAIDMVTSGHGEAALVTKPAAIASAQLGARLVAGAYLDAFAGLSRYIREATEDIRAANMAGVPLDMHVKGTALYAELLGSARATIDAAAATNVAGADDVMRRAWRDIGVEA